MEWIRLWWWQSDHYDALTSHLQERGLGTFFRAATAAIVGGLAVTALGTIWIPDPPRGFVPITCVIVASAGGVIGAGWWARRWPTRAVAMRVVMLLSAGIAVVAVVQPDPLIAMLICTTFAAVGSYIALFHPLWLLVYNFAVAGVIGAIEGVRIAAKLNAAAAVSAYAVLLLLNLAVAFGLKGVAHVLGADAVRGERDQLTGLLNRRAFYRRADAHLEQRRAQLGHVVITVIDLDRFKQLNDNHGHRTGDDALVSVARALRDTSDDTAIICRSGGEEFVIADSWHPDEVGRRAQQLCDVIAALPFDTTASVGTAGIYPAQRPGNTHDLLIELIAAADTAMYAAKRLGGNRAAHHEWAAPSSNLDDDETDYRSDGLTA